VNGQGRREAGIQRAARRLDERIDGANITPEDLVPTSEGYKLRDEVARRVAARRIDTEVELDVTAEDLQEAEDGEGFEPTPKFRRQQAALTLDEEYDSVDISAEDLQETDEGFELTPELQREVAAATIQEQLDTGQRVQEQFTRDADRFVVDAASAEQAAQKLRSNLDTSADYIRANQFEETDDGAFRLDQDISESAVADEIQGELNIDTLSEADIVRADGEFLLTKDARAELTDGKAKDAPPTPEIDPGDLRQTEEGFEIRSGVRREIAAGTIDEQLPNVSVNPEDLRRSDDSFVVNDATRREAAAAQIDEELSNVDITPEDLTETDEGFAVSEGRQREIAAMDIDEQLPNVDITPEDLTETDEGFAVSEGRQREIAAMDIDEETLTDVSPGDITETDEGFGLAEPVRRDEVRRQIIDQDEDVDPGDISGIDELTPAEQVDILLQEQPELVGGEGGDANPKAREDLLELARQDQLDEEFEDVSIPDLGPEFTDEFRREQALTSIVESEEDVDREDIASLEETDDGFRAEFTEAFQREEIAESIAEDTKGITESDIDPASDIRDLEETDEGVRPVLAQDFRQELVAAGNEGLEPEDIKRVEDLNPEEQVEFLIDNNPDIDPDTPAEREQVRDLLLPQVESGGPVVTQEGEEIDPPESNVVLSEASRRERFREAVAENNEDIDPEDIESVEELSPNEQLGFLLRSDRRDAGDIQKEKQRVESQREEIWQQYQDGEIESVQEVQRRINAIDVPGAPEFGPQFTEEFQREQIAETLNEEFADRKISKSDVVRVEDGDGLKLREDLRREIAAEELDAQIDDREIGEEDLVATDDGFRLKQASPNLAPRGPAAVLQQAVRENPDFFAAIQLDRELDQVDVTADDIIQEEGGLRFSKDLQRDLAVKEIDDQIQEVDVGRGDIERVDGQFQVSNEVQREVAAARLDDEISAIDVGTEDLREFAGDYSLNTEARRDLTARQLDQDIDAIDVGPDDLRAEPALREAIESGGRGAQPVDQFQLDQETQRELSAVRLDEEFDGIDSAEAGIGLTPSEVRPDVDIGQEDLVATDNGFELDTGAEQRVAAANLDRELRIDVTAGDLEQTDGEFELDAGAERRLLEARLPGIEEKLAEDVAVDLGRQRLDSFWRPGQAGLDIASEEDLAELGPDVDPEDLVTRVTEGEDGPTIDAELSSELKRRVVTQQIQRETTADLDPGEDIQFRTDIPAGFAGRRGAEPDLTATLTASGREREIISTAEQQGEIGGVDIREGEAAEQIEVDEQGRVVNIEERGGDVTEGVIGAVGGAVDTATDLASIASSPIISGLSRAESAVVGITPGGEIGRAAAVGGISEIYDAGKRVGGSFKRVSRGSRELLEENVVEPGATITEDLLGERAGEFVAVTGKTATSLTAGIADTDTLSERSRLAAETLSEEVAAPLGRRAGEFYGGSVNADVVTAGVASRTGVEGTASDATIERFGTSTVSTLAYTTAGLPSLGITAGEAIQDSAEFTGGQIASEGITAGLAASSVAAGSVVAKSAKQNARYAASNPAEYAGTFVGSYPLGTVAGRGLLAVAGTRPLLRARGRIRTAGADVLDLEDFAQPSVIRGEEDFPGALDRQLYQTDPAEAVRRQAQQMTPDEIDAAFGRAGVESGSVLKKALAVEPEGPGIGRAGRGFTATPDETGIDPGAITRKQVSERDAGQFEYENPGSFFSSDVSPKFTRVGEQPDPKFSPIPGLPSLGGQPTLVFARTQVRGSGAGSQVDFARELARREGETDALTKPVGSGQLNPGEIEAAVPAGAEFVDVGRAMGGPVRSAMRRAGVGSEFAVRINGVRTPVRLVAPESEVDAAGRAGIRSFLQDDRAQLGARPDAESFTARSFARERGSQPRAPRYRPTPIPPTWLTDTEQSASRAFDDEIPSTVSAPSRPDSRRASRVAPVSSAGGIPAVESPASGVSDRSAPSEVVSSGVSSVLDQSGRSTISGSRSGLSGVSSPTSAFSEPASGSSEPPTSFSEGFAESSSSGAQATSSVLGESLGSGSGFSEAVPSSAAGSSPASAGASGAAASAGESAGAGASAGANSAAGWPGSVGAGVGAESSVPWREPEEQDEDGFRALIEERPRSRDWTNPIERLAGGFR
jgi:hypothetical protein